MLHTSSSPPTMTTSLTLTITDAGRAAAISADGMGLRLTVTHVALGRAAYEPQASQTDLVSRVERVSATNIAGTAPAATARVAASFPAIPSASQSYTACEMGLFAGDPDAGGVLFAVYSSPDASHPILVRGDFDYLIAFGMTLSGVPNGSVTVQIDPNAAPFIALQGEHDRDPHAHASFARKADLSVQAYTSGLTTGSGAGYSLAVDVEPSLEVFARVVGQIHATNTGATTLAVGSLLPMPIKLYGSDGKKADPDYGRLAAGMLADFEFDGTDWVLLNPIPAPVMTSIRAANITLTPAHISGTGTDVAPMLLPDATSAPGAASMAVAAVVVSGLRPGELVMIADLNDVANGMRFGVGSLASRVANGAGRVTIPIVFTDSPASALETFYSMDLSINGLRIRHKRTISSTATITPPIISLPLDEAIGASPITTINLRPFTVMGGASAHTSTSYQVSMSPTFESLFARVEQDTVNKLAWSTPALPYSATFYVRAMFHGPVEVSEWSEPVRFSTHAKPAITQPVLLYPASGATGIAAQPRFACTPFVVTDVIDTHKWSNWEASLSPTFAAIAASSTNSTTDLTSWTPATPLAYSTTYYVRVQQVGNMMGAGPWSATAQFTTGATTPIVAKPRITSPIPAATGVRGPFISSEFAMAAGEDAPASADWQVATALTFAANTIVAQVSGDVANQTVWQPPFLPRGTYFLRMRKNGVLAGSSPWSDPVQFTWLLTAKPAITYPSNLAANMDTGVALSCSVFVSSGIDKPLRTEWQVSKLADFSTIAFSANTSLPTWRPAGLVESTAYYVRVRHIGEAGGASDWSTTVKFTTAAATGINWVSIVDHVAETSVLTGSDFGGAKSILVGATLARDADGAANGVIMTSTDGGLTWPSKIFTTSANTKIGKLNAVVFTGATWCAVGERSGGGLHNGSAFISPDGVSWTESSTGGILSDAAWNGTMFLGVGMNSAAGPYVMSSVDGSAWINQNSSAIEAISGGLNAIEWAPSLGLWIAGGMSTAKSAMAGAIIVSSDMVNWVRCTLPTGIGAINDIKWNGSMGVAVGTSSAGKNTAGVVLTTVDGINWVRRTVPCGRMCAVEWATSKWIIGGFATSGLMTSGAVWTSPDGVTWTARVPKNGCIFTICQVGATGTSALVAAGVCGANIHGAICRS
jgi:hypothetical protein